MLFNNDTLKAYAASKGLTAIEDTAFDVLSQELEYRVKELCQEASKFMHAAHRSKLTVEDVNYALVCRNIDPLLGYDSTEPLQFRAIGSFYALNDEEVDLEDLLNSPLPRIPASPSVHAHWLAIEGIQPQIPQNPLPADVRKRPHDTLQMYVENAEIKTSVRHVLSKELQAYFDKILEFTAVKTNLSNEIGENNLNTKSTKNYKKSDFLNNNYTGLDLINNNYKNLKTESKKNNDSINNLNESTNTSQQNVEAIYALQCLENDSGIQQLIPYFIQAFSTSLVTAKQDYSKDIVISMIFALLKNKYIFIDPYLHQIIPALLTAILGKNFELSTREIAMYALKYTYDRYASTYSSLAPRTINTLKRGWLDTKKPEIVQWSAVKCLSVLGDAVIDDVLVPNARIYCEDSKSAPSVRGLLKEILKEKLDHC